MVLSEIVQFHQLCAQCQNALGTINYGRLADQPTRPHPTLLHLRFSGYAILTVMLPCSANPGVSYVCMSVRHLSLGKRIDGQKGSAMPMWCQHNRSDWSVAVHRTERTEWNLIVMRARVCICVSDLDTCTYSYTLAATFPPHAVCCCLTCASTPGMVCAGCVVVVVVVGSVFARTNCPIATHLFLCPHPRTV